MSAETHKAIARRVLQEVFNAGNLAVIDELFAQTYVNHTAPPGLTPGPDGTKVFVAQWRAAFPDTAFTLEDLIAEGDKVVVRWTATGTHRGPLMGIPPTGKKVTIAGIDIFRVADNRVVEHWDSVDQLGLLQQLGAIPAPGHTPT